MPLTSGDICWSARTDTVTVVAIDNECMSEKFRLTILLPSNTRLGYPDRCGNDWSNTGTAKRGQGHQYSDNR